MKIVRHIPNALTCCNLLCGCIGLASLTNQSSIFELKLSSLFIIAGAIFDFLDGLAARLLKAHSPIGKQLDSLADMVTFGVLPSFIIYQVARLSLSSEQETHYIFFNGGFQGFLDRAYIVRSTLLPLFAFFIAIFSALRLAKFNIDYRQTDQFIGLPTPANAIVVASLPFILQNHPELTNYILSPIVLLIYIIVVSALMVAELSLFSLKFRHFKWTKNELRYSFLLASFVLLILLQSVAVPLIVTLYVVLSVIFKPRSRKNE